MIMPFGKYQGYEVSEMPMDYIKRLWRNVDLREPLYSEIYSLIRNDHYIYPAAPDQDRIRVTYRELAMEYHPDRIGGSGDIMKGINIFYERLKGED